MSSLFSIFLYSACSNNISILNEVSESVEYIIIPDPILEKGIRAEINKPIGNLTQEDMEFVTELKFEMDLNDPTNFISDLEGIQYAINRELPATYASLRSGGF
jgi:hypothetical protein